MARRSVFFSFHFDNDVMRVQQIRNIGSLEDNFGPRGVEVVFDSRVLCAAASPGPGYLLHDRAGPYNGLWSGAAGALISLSALSIAPARKKFISGDGDDTDEFGKRVERS